MNRFTKTFGYIFTLVLSATFISSFAVIGEVCPQVAGGFVRPSCANTNSYINNPVGCINEGSGGCDDGGERCEYSGEQWLCVAVQPGDIIVNPDGECQFLGECGAYSGGCDTGQRCYDLDSGHSCVRDDSCTDEPGTLGNECRTGIGDLFTRCDAGLLCSSGFCIDNQIDENIEAWQRRPGQPYDGPLLANFTGLMQGLFKILYPVSIIIGVAYLLIGAYGFMVSEGDPQKVKEAQTQISSAIVGILFVLLSATILRIIINSVLGVSVNL